MLGDGVGRDEYIGQKHGGFRIIESSAVGRRSRFRRHFSHGEEANSDWPCSFECL